MLYDAFKSEGLQVSLAAIAIEKFLAMDFGMWLDFGVENPLHVLQRQLLCEWSFGRVRRGRLARGSRCDCLFRNLGIKALPNVDEYVCGKLGTCVFCHLLPIFPAVTNDFVRVGRDPASQRCLNLFPVLVNEVPSFLGRSKCCLEATVTFNPLISSLGVRSDLLLARFGFGALSDESRLQKLPCAII
jgi:hypothetical protein